VIRRYLTYANAMSTLALFVALGGGAFAATRFVGGNGVVTFCVSPSGVAKVLKVGQKCGKGKAQIPVNQTGPQGPPGSGGGGSYAAGSGLTLNGNTFSANLSQLQARLGGCASDQVLQTVSQAGTPTCVSVHAYYQQSGNGSLTAAVAVPAGNWVVVGQETASINTSSGGTMVCEILQNGNEIGHASQTAGGSKPMSAAPVAFTTTTGPNTAIEILCDTGGAPTFTPGAGIYAIPVAAVN
jgi:hypothetical protein